MRTVRGLIASRSKAHQNQIQKHHKFIRPYVVAPAKDFRLKDLDRREVLVVRVHPEYREKQRIPDSLRDDHFWMARYEDISAFERYLTRNGIAIRKFFLNVSKKEQKKRFMERLVIGEKSWKFSAADIKEGKYSNGYQDAYEKMIRNTAGQYAPWIFAPADNTWFSTLLVVAKIVEPVRERDLEFPKLTRTQLAALKEARKQLERE